MTTPCQPNPEAEVLAILAKLTPIERVVWLELGRRILSGEVKPECAMDWLMVEIRRLEAALPGA